MQQNPPAGARPARQRRSLEAAGAIAAAARELLRRQSFESLSVAEIAAAAGTSVGGFYARYADKQAVLESIDASILDEVASAFDTAMEPHLTADSELSDVIRTYVDVMVAEFRGHRREILAIRRHVSSDPTGGYRRRMTDFNDHVHGTLRLAVRRSRGGSTEEIPDFGLNFALFAVSAAAREAVLAGSLAAYPIEVDDERLIEELTALFLAYLARGS